MGCFDGQGNQAPGSIMDLDKDIAKSEAGRGGFSRLGNIYGGLFRSRRFNQNSLEATTEAPDPLFGKPKPTRSFSIVRRRGNSGGI